MTEHKDMTISEIEEVLKEYTCEFVHLGENYYIDCQVIDVIYIFRTCYDYTQKFYFISKEKANDFLKKIGDNNIKKFLNFLREDLIEEGDVFETDFYNKHEVIKDEIKYYSLEENEDKSLAYIIRPFKENGKYAIEYIRVGIWINEPKEDFYFSSYERAKNAVKEIGEYNILHYYFFIKDEFLEKDTKVFEDTTKHKDMTLDEIYEIVKEYKCNFREGEDNWYVYFKDGMYKCEITRDSEIHLIYFESEHKIHEFMHRVGYENFNKLFGYLNNDKDIIDKIYNERKDDMVKNPSHYQGKNGLEVFDILENFLEDVESYYLGNVIKYILRYKNKNGLEDLKKAREYLDKLIELEEK